MHAELRDRGPELLALADHDLRVGSAQARGLHNWFLFAEAGLDTVQVNAVVHLCWRNNWNGQQPATTLLRHLGPSGLVRMYQDAEDALAVLRHHTREWPQWRPWVDEYARRMGFV